MVSLGHHVRSGAEYKQGQSASKTATYEGNVAPPVAAEAPDNGSPGGESRPFCGLPPAPIAESGFR
jgi:hypothetical protein